MYKIVTNFFDKKCVDLYFSCTSILIRQRFCKFVRHDFTISGYQTGFVISWTLRHAWLVEAARNHRGWPITAPDNVAKVVFTRPSSAANIQLDTLVGSGVSISSYQTGFVISWTLWGGPTDLLYCTVCTVLYVLYCMYCTGSLMTLGMLALAMYLYRKKMQTRASSALNALPAHTASSQPRLGLMNYPPSAPPAFNQQFLTPAIEMQMQPQSPPLPPQAPWPGNSWLPSWWQACRQAAAPTPAPVPCDRSIKDLSKELRSEKVPNTVM